MNDTIARWIRSLPDLTLQRAFEQIVNPLGDRYSTLCLSNPTLAIKAGGSAIVKADEVLYACVDGILVYKAADTDMAALAGTVAADLFNVFCFFIDKAGTLTSAMGTAGATIGAVKWPAFPEHKAFLGAVIINPTGTGDFVGGTTALDDATVVPNAVYLNGNIGPFDPSVRLR